MDKIIIMSEGKKVHGRPRTMFLDWLLKTEEVRRTKDARPGQIKMESQMETCRGRTLQRDAMLKFAT